jgi:Holliday junction resolvase RusA-like endonuclease
MQHFILNELPPSTNHSHFIKRLPSGQVLRIPKKATKDFREFCGWQAKAQGITRQDGYLKVSVAASYGMYKNGKPKVGDVHNLTKELLDALNGIAYTDDSQVIELTIRREFTEKIGVSVTIDTFS